MCNKDTLQKCEHTNLISVKINNICIQADSLNQVTLKKHCPTWPEFRVLQEIKSNWPQKCANVSSHIKMIHMSDPTCYLFRAFTYVLIYVPWAGNSKCIEKCKIIMAFQHSLGYSNFTKKEHVGSEMCIILIGPYTNVKFLIILAILTYKNYFKACESTEHINKLKLSFFWIV